MPGRPPDLTILTELNKIVTKDRCDPYGEGANLPAW